MNETLRDRLAAFWGVANRWFDRLEQCMLWLVHWPRGAGLPTGGFSLGELLFVCGSTMVLGMAAISVYRVAGIWALYVTLVVAVALIGVCIAAMQRGLNRQKRQGIFAKRQSLTTPRSLRLPLEFITFGALCVSCSLFLRWAAPTLSEKPEGRIYHGVFLLGVIPCLLVGIAGLFDYRICLAVGGKTSKLRLPPSTRAIACTLYYGGFAYGAYVALFILR